MMIAFVAGPWDPRWVTGDYSAIWLFGSITIPGTLSHQRSY